MNVAFEWRDMQTACTYCIWEIGLMRLQTATMMLLWFPPPRQASLSPSLSSLSETLLLVSHREVSSNPLFSFLIFFISLYIYIYIKLSSFAIKTVYWETSMTKTLCNGKCFSGVIHIGFKVKTKLNRTHPHLKLTTSCCCYFCFF